MYERLAGVFISLTCYLRNKKNGQIAHDFTILMSGTVISQLLLLASSPLLTRLYTPKDFGIFGLSMAITNVLALIVTGRYELAIILPRELTEAFNIVVLSFGLIICSSLVFFFATIIIPVEWLLVLGIEDIVGLLFLLPLLVMFQSLYQVLYYWLNRQQNFRSMAKTRLWIVVLGSLISITIGYTKVISGGLVLAQIAAYAIVTIAIILGSRHEIKPLYKDVNFDSVRILAKRYLNFPKYLIIAHSMETLSAQLPLIMLNSLFGSSIAGYFSLTQRVIGAPVGFIAKTMGDIMRERFSFEYREQGNCYLAFNKSLKYLTVIAFIPALIFGLWGPELFCIVFGESWAMAGVYARLLTMMTFLQMIASPLSIMYIIAEKQRVELYLQFARVAGCFLAIYGGYIYSSENQLAMILFGIVMSMVYLFMIYQCRKWAKGVSDA
ncbi:hypothetical protein AXX12_08265 [Anaerosporomusa subterranea]|uniref:Polysaccharide biosynthesis protein n=1 Tax=Anaerosporomusa subterranea TaxID=1794912 RepID=A0A154BSC5_ANASB|nr:oligosaccharide flippase family protein [Anaerosporomusa subterranea]KYZ76418.1 hypothetical protein AXX12_08265 [Anaerosporomusa subterranea]